VPPTHPESLQNLSLPRTVNFGHVRHLLYSRTWLLTPPPVSALLVASQRLPTWASDFVIFGSALHALAIGNFGDGDIPVILQKWRGTLLLSTASCDSVDWSYLGGLELVRMLTGRSGRFSSNEPHIEHLQLLRIGNFTALLVAKADAVDERGKPVLIRSRRTISSVLQMVASGSEILHQGILDDRVLCSIDAHPLHNVLPNTSAETWVRRADGIIEALRSIRDLANQSVTEHTPFQLTGFVRMGSLSLRPLDHGRSLLPTARVLADLFPVLSPQLVGTLRRVGAESQQREMLSATSTPAPTMAASGSPPEHPPDSDFSSALNALDCSGASVRLLTDLGFYVWHRNCSLTKIEGKRWCPSDIMLQELWCGLGIGNGSLRARQVPFALPARLAHPELPQPFPRVQNLVPSYSSSGRCLIPPPASTLLVASQRISLSDIDFVMDGPALFDLWSGLGLYGKRRNRVVLQRWRGTVVVSSERCHNGWKMQEGDFQLESMLTGKSSEFDINDPHFEHLQVLRIGKFDVLFAARVGAVNDDGKPVLISRSTRGNVVAFDMLVSGAATMQQAKVRGRKVQSIESHFASSIFHKINLRRRLRKVVWLLQSIRGLFNESVSEQASFEFTGPDSNFKFALVPLEHRRSLLPTAHVLAELFPATSAVSASHSPS